jgi:hypothetical protein
MLSQRYAKWLIAPGNAVQQVKDRVRSQQGYVSDQPHGQGVLDGLRCLLSRASETNLTIKNQT